MQKTDAQEYLTVKQFAALYGVTPQRVYAMIASADIVYERDAWQRLLIPRSELIRKMDEATTAEAKRGRGIGVGAGHKGLRRSGRPRKRR